MDEKKRVKRVVPKEAIYKLMLSLTYLVTGLFAVKNLIGKDWEGLIAVSSVIVVFSIVLILMRAAKTKETSKQLVVSVGLLFVVFVVSLYSGECYSDDFILYLAVIGISGMYLRPHYAKVQTIVCDVLLVLQYLLHPEKAESLEQFITCILIFNLVGIIFYLVISRGSSFIEISDQRAEEAEVLLDSIRKMSQELEENFESSTKGIEGLKYANTQLECNSAELKQGSYGITQVAREVTEVCRNVQGKVQTTEKQVDALTDKVRGCEESLSLNNKNMDEMEQQVEAIQTAMNQVNEVFCMLGKHMEEISEITEQLNSISGSTNMLALNASIEAARAGASGAGFAVVAAKVQELAVDSNKCSGQVVSVVAQMQQQIQETTNQLTVSSKVIQGSLATLQGLRDSFNQLTSQFGFLYENIDIQNDNVKQVDSIFESLMEKIAQMNLYSDANEDAVSAIVGAMDMYKESTEQMINDAEQVRGLSGDMLKVANQ